MHLSRAAEELIAAYRPEARRAQREFEILVASGAQFAEYQIMRVHAPAGVVFHPDRNRVCLPVGGRKRRGPGGHALGVVAMLDVELTGLAEYERNPVGQALIVVGQNNVDVARGSERAVKWVGKCREDCGGSDDGKILDVESSTDLKDYVLQLAAVHGRSSRPYRLEDPPALVGIDQTRERGFLAKGVGMFRDFGHRPQ